MGRASSLSDLRGHVVVLTFIYTRCPLPDFCPYMDRKFADLAETLATFPRRAEAVRLLSISFDPDHDTPEILRKHAQSRGATAPLWTFAVASHEELARVAPGLGLIYGPGKDEIIHNLCTAVIDQQGRLTRLEVGTQRNKWSSADLLKTVYSLISRRAEITAQSLGQFPDKLTDHLAGTPSSLALMNGAQPIKHPSPNAFVLLDLTN